jgi:hypothetical protein
MSKQDSNNGIAIRKTMEVPTYQIKLMNMRTALQMPSCEGHKYFNRTVVIANAVLQR